MSIEFVLLRESLLAKSTFIWLISTVNSLVIFKVRTFNEASVAVFALVRLDARHAGIVIAFALLIAEDLAARVTLVSFRITRYYCYMTTITILGALVPLSLCLFIKFVFSLAILKEKYIFNLYTTHRKFTQHFVKFLYK